MACPQHPHPHITPHQWNKYKDVTVKWLSTRLEFIAQTQNQLKRRKRYKTVIVSQQQMVEMSYKDKMMRNYSLQWGGKMGKIARKEMSTKRKVLHSLGPLHRVDRVWIWRWNHCSWVFCLISGKVLQVEWIFEPYFFFLGPVPAISSGDEWHMSGRVACVCSPLGWVSKYNKTVYYL